MRIFRIAERDPNLDFQLIDAGDGLLETYTLGEKTDRLPLGEVAIRTIEREIASMDQYQAQAIIKAYYDNMVRMREHQPIKTGCSNVKLSLVKKSE